VASSESTSASQAPDQPFFSAKTESSMTSDVLKRRAAITTPGLAALMPLVAASLGNSDIMVNLPLGVLLFGKKN
jgi:hypothetical protein